MTKGHLNEIMAGLCARLKMRECDLVAVHEAGLVALGIDSNAIPYGLDFLLLNGAEDGTVREFTFEGFDIRLHALGEFGADESISLVAPEVILKTIHKSPSGRCLMEQRAALAELLYFDEMDDDELRQFASHVRP